MLNSKVILFTFLMSFCALTASAQFLKQAWSITSSYDKTITEQKVQQAQDLSDLNEDYASIWINEEHYIAVHLSLTTEADSITHTSNNTKLTEAQKALLSKAEIQDRVTVTVEYWNENAATKQKEKRTMKFSRHIESAQRAQFPGGIDAMDNYIEKNLIQEIRQVTDLYPSARVAFWINEDGQITELDYEMESRPEVNAIIRKALLNSPQWIPAKNKEGQNITDKLYFLLGDASGC